MEEFATALCTFAASEAAAQLPQRDPATSCSAPGRGELTVRGTPDSPSLDLRIEGTFHAVIALAPTADGKWQPKRVAVGGSEDEMTLGSMQPSTTRVFCELTARAGTFLLRLDALPPARRLPRLVRWLCAFEDLFSARCAHCGRVLDTADGTADALVPPTVRCSKLRAFHVRCAELSCGDVGVGWLNSCLGTA